MGSAPSPPPTPDPYKTAAAQQMANVEVAVANTWLQNADEDAPGGTVRYIGSGKFVDTHTYDKDGNISGTRTVEKPKRVVTLSTKAAQAWDKGEDLRLMVNDWALAQTGLLRIQQSDPIDPSTLPARLSNPAAATIDVTPVAPGSLTLSIGATDLTAHLADVRTAMKARMDADILVERQALITDLRAQGLSQGMPAYDRAIELYDRKTTDARIQADLAASQEQSRMVQLEGLVADFHNRATALKFQMDNQARDLGNAAQRERFRALAEACEYVNTVRQQSLQEAIAIRASNVNEMSALIHGGQVPTPQFTGFKPSQIDRTPVAESVYQSAQLDMQKWQVQVQQQQSMFGGILGFAGNLMGGLLAFSDARLKTGIVPVRRGGDGLMIYAWRYLWDAATEVRIGPLAQEVPGAIRMPSGYLAVRGWA